MGTYGHPPLPGAGTPEPRVDGAPRRARGQPPPARRRPRAPRREGSLMASWVCPECGLDYDTISPPDGAVAVRSFPRRFRERVEAAGDVLRERPAPATWSV